MFPTDLRVISSFQHDLRQSSFIPGDCYGFSAKLKQSSSIFGAYSIFLKAMPAMWRQATSGGGNPRVSLQSPETLDATNDPYWWLEEDESDAQGDTTFVSDVSRRSGHPRPPTFRQGVS